MKAARCFLIVWFVATLPIVLVLAFNAYTRFVFLETCAHWWGKLRPINYVFIGDSNTVGGGNWGWRLKHNPFAARNLGEGGYMVWQVKGKLAMALSYHPKFIFVLAGTNDLFSRDGINQGTIDDFDEMLRTIKNAHAKAVVTLVPYEESTENANEISMFNEKLKELCKKENAIVVDLNPVIAPSGKLLPKYTWDGIHFSQAAYYLWQNELRGIISTNGNAT